MFRPRQLMLLMPTAQRSKASWPKKQSLLLLGQLKSKEHQREPGPRLQLVMLLVFRRCRHIS